MAHMPAPELMGGVVASGQITTKKWWGKDSVATEAFWNADDSLVLSKVQEAASPLVSAGGWDLKSSDDYKTEWMAVDQATKSQMVKINWTKDYDGLFGGEASGEKINFKVGDVLPFAWMVASWTGDWSSVTVAQVNAAAGQGFMFQTAALNMTVLSGAETLLAGSAIVAAAMLM